MERGKSSQAVLIELKAVVVAKSVGIAGATSARFIVVAVNNVTVHVRADRPCREQPFINTLWDIIISPYFPFAEYDLKDFRLWIIAHGIEHTRVYFCESFNFAHLMMI